MRFRQLLRYVLVQGAGLHINRTLPRGTDVHYDIANALPNQRMDVVFDVGANEGQSARRFIETYPGVRILCFEPVFETFEALIENVSSEDQVECYRFALGGESAEKFMSVSENRLMSHLIKGEQEHEGTDQRESVSVRTMDNFCEEEGIERVNYLKIDTEGHDLEVLLGADAMLSQQAVDLIEVEAGANPKNEHHVPLESLKSHLEGRGYFLFGFYHQREEWPTRSPHLRRVNALFVSQYVIESNT